MFSSKTLRGVSSHMVVVTYSSINAILLLTSLFAHTLHAAPTITMQHAMYSEITRRSLDFHHDTISPVYNQYRIQRLHDSTIYLRSIKIEGFPNFRDLSHTTRMTLSAGNVTLTHRSYLGYLLAAMRQIELDELLFPGAEEDGFIQDFRDIVVGLEGLVENLDRWIEVNELQGTNHLPLEHELDLTSALHEFERTLDALYILQEMDEFMHTFRVDFTRLFHQF